MHALPQRAKQCVLLPFPSQGLLLNRSLHRWPASFRVRHTHIYTQSQWYASHQDILLNVVHSTHNGNVYRNWCNLKSLAHSNRIFLSVLFADWFASSATCTAELTETWFIYAVSIWRSSYCIVPPRLLEKLVIKLINILYQLSLDLRTEIFRKSDVLNVQKVNGSKCHAFPSAHGRRRRPAVVEIWFANQPSRTSTSL